MNSSRPDLPHDDVVPLLPALDGFAGIIAATPGLSEKAQQQVIGLYDTVMRYFEKHDMAGAPTVLAKLIELTQAGNPDYMVREDGTSTYTHHLSQIHYRIWVQEHPDEVERRNQKSCTTGRWSSRIFKDRADTITDAPSVKRYSKEELEAAFVRAIMHDAGEDYNYEPSSFMRLLRAIASYSHTWCNGIVEAFDHITERIGEKYEQYNARVGKNKDALSDKLYDRIHNLASKIGTPRGETHIRKYINKTRDLIKRNFDTIMADGEKLYLADYLCDQCELIEAYLDTKNTVNLGRDMDPRIIQKLINLLRECWDRYTLPDRDDSKKLVLPFDIHPMMAIVRRINDDHQFWQLSNQPAPDTGPALPPSDPPSGGRGLPKLKKAS